MEMSKSNKNVAINCVGMSAWLEYVANIFIMNDQQSN
jgi:hypothetical protein